MKIAFLVYYRMSTLDFVGAFDSPTRLKTTGFIPGFEWDLCTNKPRVKHQIGLQILAKKVAMPLSGYDCLVVPGGPGTRRLIHDK